jgi:stringent starvation protein B
MEEGFTPHIAVWVNAYTQVPRQYVQEEQIVLNISPTACQGLNIDNDWLRFSARFGGKVEEVFVPIGHVLSFFARENGEGMGFEVHAYEGEEADENHVDTQPNSTKPSSATVDENKTSKKPASKGHLKLVK